MNYFDSEKRIIEQLQSVNISDISFVNYSFPLIRFFLSFVSSRCFDNWTDNSSNTNNPPDYINSKEKLMLEIMRVDDHEGGVNHPNALESKAYYRLEKSMREHGKTLEGLTVFINPSLDNSSPNNHLIYLSNLRRIVEKHAKRISTYRKEHTGYKLGFLIFDESPAYVETKSKYDGALHPGDVICSVRPYHALYDKNILDYLLQFDIDYVIWMTPYKLIPDNPKKAFKEVYLLDVGKARKKAIRNPIEYNYENLICIEAE